MGSEFLTCKRLEVASLQDSYFRERTTQITTYYCVCTAYEARLLLASLIINNYECYHYQLKC